MDYIVRGILLDRILEWVAFPFSKGNLPNPGVAPRSPTLQVDFLPTKPPGKPKNTGAVQLQLLQHIGQGIDLDYCDIEWLALETNRDHSVIFEIVSKYCISDSFFEIHCFEML